MTTNPEKAANNFENGYNCAQSVFMVYSEKFGIDTETALKLSSSFGGGMGRLREVCGAVSAMFMIAGLADQIEGGIISDAKLSWLSWLAIACLPLLSAMTAMGTAYYTVKKTLEKMM